MHISRDDFYHMTPGEFWEALHAYREEVEANRRHLGELTRGLAVRIVNLFIKKESRYSEASKLWPMPWDTTDNLTDTVRELSALSDEERTEMANNFLKKIDNGRL